MTIEMLEERLATLELMYVDLKRDLDDVRRGEAKPHWIDEIYGAMKDYPEWDEVIRLGREWRQNYQAPGDEIE